MALGHTQRLQECCNQCLRAFVEPPSSAGLCSPLTRSLLLVWLLQIGGSDQWGNITAGTDLIRRLMGGDSGEDAPQCFGLTFPLLVRDEGVACLPCLRSPAAVLSCVLTAGISVKAEGILLAYIMRLCPH